MVCHFCSHECSPRGMAQHVRAHAHTSQSYYDLLYGAGKCKVCGAPTRYLDLAKGYARFCPTHRFSETSEWVKRGWTDERKEKHAATFARYANKDGRPKGAKNKHPYPADARIVKSLQTRDYWKTHQHSWSGRQHTEITKDLMSRVRAEGLASGAIKLGTSFKGVYVPRYPNKYVGDANNIVFRSSWERGFMRYCDETPGVLRWSSEELRIAYVSPIDGKLHTYFPDFAIEIKTLAGVKKFVVEIKPFRQTKPPEPRRKTKKFLMEAATFAVNQAKWQAAKEFCDTQGWTFLVLTERELFERLK